MDVPSSYSPEGIVTEHGKDEVADILLLQVLDVDFLHAESLRLGPGRFHFLTLADIGGEGDHLAIVLIPEPLQDDRGVQAAGVGEDDFIDGCSFSYLHWKSRTL